MALFPLVNDAEPILFVQGHREIGESLVGDAGAELAVERVNGGLAERVAVDLMAQGRS